MSNLESALREQVRQMQSAEDVHRNSAEHASDSCDPQRERDFANGVMWARMKLEAFIDELFDTE